MPDSCQPYSAVDFNHTGCKKKVLLLGSRAHLVLHMVVAPNKSPLLNIGNMKFKRLEWPKKILGHDQMGRPFRYVVRHMINDKPLLPSPVASNKAALADEEREEKTVKLSSPPSSLSSLDTLQLGTGLKFPCGRTGRHKTL